MRIGRLDLLRYGHFTGHALELPVGDTDLHILFGPNEAGKSTALAAIEDMLFGISTRSPYGFLHDYSAMRIGALLQNGTEALEIVRRKGSKDTLLDANGLPLAGGEAALRPFLAGADRSFFERMFSLDHVRLETGGKEILEAKDEIGQMLFAAGTGIAGLRHRLEGLSTEADSLWAARRARHRKYYVAYDKLKEAEKELREQTLTTHKWQELKSAFETAMCAYAEVETEFEELSVNRKRLGRIRRVYPHVRRKAELERALEELGAVVLLPEESREILDASEREESEGLARIDTLSNHLERVQEEQAALTYDERLLTRADDIERLHERRIEVRPMREDLPLRQAELEIEQNRMLGLARELGWRDGNAEELIARLPGRVAVRGARSLFNERGGLDSDVKNKAASLRQALAEQTELQKRFEVMEDLIDIAGLEAVVRALRQSGDIGERIRSANQRLEESRQRVNHLLSLLHPSVESPKAAAQAPVPARVAVENHRAKVRDWESRTRDLARQSTQARLKLQRTRESRERLAGHGPTITIEALEEARNDRDQLWRLIKKKHIENAPVSSGEAGRHADVLDDLASAFESAIALADERADRRLANAETVARLTALSLDIHEQEADLKLSQKQQEALALEGERLATDWETLWQASGVRPRDPDAMLEWLRTHGELLDAVARLAGAAGDLESWEIEERSAKEKLLKELSSIGSDCAELEDQSLSVVLERAESVLGSHQEQKLARSQLLAGLRQAETTFGRQRHELEGAKDEWRRWCQEWSASLQALGLDAETNPDTVEEQLDVIDRMREVASSIENLRSERIDKIIGTIAAYEQAVAQTLGKLAGDLEGMASDDAVLELEKRLNAAQSIQRRKAEKTRDIDEIQSDLSEQRENREKARQSVASLKETARVGTNDDLRIAIGKSDRYRQYRSDLEKTSRELEQQGDGLPIGKLEVECQGVDPDRVAAQEESLEAELEAARGRLTEAAQVKSNAEQAMRTVDGDAAAARAEAKRQEALADIREVSERYVRVRSSAMLLQWAIDRYRREKQAPLLKRASELFATVTSRSFEDLRVEYDSKDQAYLTGRRTNGEVVPVSGMSSGTADQLYLALRVAAIEDYLDRSDALPFVADDLFVNFDDRRAGAGFSILGELARKTQVLFFTHHAHLLDIAREALGGTLSVVDMNEDRAGMAG